MGSAIAEQLKEEFSVYAFDKEPGKTENLLGINATGSIADLLKQVDIVILAVKPQDFAILLEEIRNYTGDKLVISIAAGITTSYIEKRLNAARVIRAMPNLPAKVGKGMICLSKGKSATDKDLNIILRLFRKLGEALLLREDMLNAATAISGSGPGYLYDWSEGKGIEEVKKYARDIFIPSLRKIAQSLGFSPKQAKILAEVTAKGSIAYLEKTDLSALEAKKQVVSKGGTTEAALEVLHRGGSLGEAVKAAKERADKLAEKEQRGWNV